MAGTVAIALGGALFLAVGFVLQQRAAADEPPDERLSLRLLGRLLRRRLWLAGIGAMAAGQVLGAVALGRGDLALIEPVSASNLLFALPLSAWWNHRRLRLREGVGAVALMIGLTAFLVAGDPHGGSTARLPWPSWALSGGAIAAVALLLVLVGRRRQVAAQATMLASAAGALYGLQDALTQRTMSELAHGLFSTLVSWPLFALVAVAVVGLLLAQSAFEAAPLAASLPAVTVAEPFTGIAFGVGVYAEHINLAGAMLAIEILGFATAVVGIVLVAGSPVVSGEAEAHEERLAHEAERAA